MRNKTVPEMETIEREYKVVPSTELKHFRTNNSYRSDNVCQDPTPKVWHPTLEPYYFKRLFNDNSEHSKNCTFLYINCAMSVPINLIS